MTDYLLGTNIQNKNRFLLFFNSNYALTRTKQEILFNQIIKSSAKPRQS